MGRAHHGAARQQPPHPPGEHLHRPRPQTLEPGLTGRDSRLSGLIEQIDAELPALLRGAPWASVSIRLGASAAVWTWNAPRAAAPGQSGTPPPTERVDPDTVLRWASLAKPVTALIVLRLVALGRLTLDDPAVARSPSFRPSPANLAGHDPGSITIGHLLTHSSGMGVARYQPIGWESARPRAADLLSLQQPPGAWSLAHAPGTSITYGSAAYLWLQSIVEDITGLPFERAARSLLLDPMGLPRVWFLGDGPAPGQIAWGLDEHARPITPRRSPAPAATGLFATPSDIVRLLAGLATPEARLHHLLAPTLRADILRNHTPFAAEAWGLGWRLQDSEHGPVFRHAGWPDGVTAYVEGLPRLGLLTCLQIGRSGARRALVRIADIARWHAARPEEGRAMLGAETDPS